MVTHSEPEPRATRARRFSRCRLFASEPLTALLLAALVAFSATAGPFSQLVIFGDSLSDVGNVSQATASLPFVATTPGPHYYHGRFSNGPVYAELLADGLDLPPVVHSRSGGNNFAHGGAMTSGTGFFESFVIRDIDDQVDNYLDSRTTDPNTLFVVFAGANDLLGGQTDMTVPVGRLANDIVRLIAAGAQNFLIPNLPLLGYTPRFNGNATSLATNNARSLLFNSTLATMLDDLEATNTTVKIARLDVANLFLEMIQQPSEFSLTNVADSAAPGLSPGDSSYDTSQIADNPNEYLFWDDLHPTAAVHAIFAERALELFVLPGDFNDDNVVDAADYIVWRKMDGTSAGYDAWQTQFGASSGSGSLSDNLADVPEPTACVAILLGAVFAWGAGRRLSN